MFLYLYYFYYYYVLFCCVLPAFSKAHVCVWHTATGP